MKLILASQSPRRSEILSAAGYDFEVRVSSCEERIDQRLSPAELAQSLAKQKAHAVYSGGELVLAADTLVVIDGEILGKPVNAENAAKMLRQLSGAWHSVFTGFYILSKEGGSTHCAETAVKFYDLTQKDIDAYIMTGEPFDKAGAYGIQGRASLFVEKIEGDYFNVVGLPAAAVSRELEKLGILPVWKGV